jgi:hypothetical protein
MLVSTLTSQILIAYPAMPNGVIQSILYDCLQLNPANSHNIGHISNSDTMQQQRCNDTDTAVSAAVSASVLQDARLDGLVYLIRGTYSNIASQKIYKKEFECADSILSVVMCMQYMHTSQCGCLCHYICMQVR